MIPVGEHGEIARIHVYYRIRIIEQVTIYRKLLIGHLDQPEGYDIS